LHPTGVYALKGKFSAFPRQNAAAICLYPALFGIARNILIPALILTDPQLGQHAVLAFLASFHGFKLQRWAFLLPWLQSSKLSHRPDPFQFPMQAEKGVNTSATLSYQPSNSNLYN